MNKRFVSILLAVLMVFTMMPMTASAMYDDDEPKGKYYVDPPIGLTLTYNGKEQSGLLASAKSNLINPYGCDVYDYKATNAGRYTATACLWGDFGPQTFVWSDGTTADKKITFVINKAANPLKVSPKTANVKFIKLKKTAQKLAVTKVIQFTNKLNDRKTYTLSSAKKGSKSFKKYFTINKTTGKVTIKRGLKKGTYKVKVKVKASGDNNYKASAIKTVTFKVKVK